MSPNRSSRRSGYKDVMPDRDQVLRFAVGEPAGRRSRTWRLSVPRRKSDILAETGNSVKVSLHEPGPARFALTSEFVGKGAWQAPEGLDPRLATEWARPRPTPPKRIARPLSIIVPWHEVLERDVHDGRRDLDVAAAGTAP